MALTAMSALKSLIDSESFLNTIRATDTALSYGVYYQTVPENVDISTGDVFVLDHKGEEYEYTTESVLLILLCSIVIYSKSFERVDQVITPVLLDLLEDYEQSIQIAGCTSYNLEILRNTKGLLDSPDRQGNDVYMSEIDLRLQYHRPRKNSYNAITD